MTGHVLSAVGLLLLLAGPASAQTATSHAPTPQTLSLARQVLGAMDAENLLIAGVESAVPAQKRLKPDIPEIFWDSVTSQMHRRASEVVDSMAPLYAGLFTAAELTDLLAFYQSPTGHRLAAVQAELSAAMSSVGQRWGGRIAADVIKQLIDQGVNFNDH